MSITPGVIAQSPGEPDARGKVFDNNPDGIGIWKCWFLLRGENRRTLRKTSRSMDESQQQTRSTYDANGPGIERRPHCSHSALTTVPSLLPNVWKLH